MVRWSGLLRAFRGGVAGDVAPLDHLLGFQAEGKDLLLLLGREQILIIEPGVAAGMRNFPVIVAGYGPLCP